MRDICLISRDAGHLMKMRDCPAECGTVDTYATALYPCYNEARYKEGRLYKEKWHAATY